LAQRLKPVLEALVVQQPAPCAWIFSPKLGIIVLVVLNIGRA
jgi:hypothetical protein